MTTPAPQFDPVKYKTTTREQWQSAAKPWHDWGPTIGAWLDPVTEIMLDMARAAAGQRILDVAAGAGGQTLLAAKRVGPGGRVLATDIAPNILRYTVEAAKRAGYHNVETQVLDGEQLEVEPGAFDIVMSRVGLIYFPDQHKALLGMHRALKPGGRVAAIVYSTAEHNGFFSIPVSIIRRRAQLPPPLPGQPGPFSLGGAGALEAAYTKAGFKDIKIKVVPAPLAMVSASECVRFEKESFGALHQMLSGLDQAGKEAAWEEITRELGRFQTPTGFIGPCEMVVGVGTK